MNWTKPCPMKDAPRDGTPILLKTTCHGLVEAWFDKGHWEEHHEYGPEYIGAAWICADDAFQIEVEEEFAEGRFSPLAYHDGTAVGWWPIPPRYQTLNEPAPIAAKRSPKVRKVE